MQGAFDASLADRAPAHVGLCIGKLEVGARDFVLALVPFPDWNDDVADDARTAPAAAKRKTLSASGDTSPLNVDDDWIVEHATQVSRMLPGGLAVVGVYAFCSDASWRGSAPALTRAIVEVAEAEDERGARSPSTRSRHQRCSERLVLHLSSDTRKLAAKRCRPGNAARLLARPRTLPRRTQVRPRHERDGLSRGRARGRDTPSAMRRGRGGGPARRRQRAVDEAKKDRCRR